MNLTLLSGISCGHPFGDTATGRDCTVLRAHGGVVSPERAALPPFPAGTPFTGVTPWNGMTIPRRYALPCTRKTAHSSLSNCRF